MTHVIKVDARFLNTKVARKFDASKGVSFEKAYQRALDCIIDPEELPYAPTAYIFPCIIRKEIKVKDEILCRIFFNMSCVDPDDVTKLAMFPSIYLIERLPPKYVTCSIAHELAHVMDLEGSVEGSLKYLNARLRGGYMAMAKMQERGAETAYERFKEPVKSWLYEWDDRVAMGKDKETVTKGAPFMDYDQFLRCILGCKYEKFIEEQVTKIKAKLKL